MKKLLFAYFYPNKAMARRFPKAAKKRRVRTKWLNRFGADTGDVMRDLSYKENPFLALIPKGSFDGSMIPLPFLG